MRCLQGANTLRDDGQRLIPGRRTKIALGVAIALVILAFNILGDTLRDALDPQLDERL